MSISWTVRQRPPVRAWERVVSRLLWQVRLTGQRLAATSDFSGWRFRAYAKLAKLEERWSMRVTQADMLLAKCPMCGQQKMHVILRPGETRWTNRKVCFGCQHDTPHQAEH